MDKQPRVRYRGGRDGTKRMAPTSDEAIMATAVTTEQGVETAIAYLREAGRAAEADAVEALLTERCPGRRRRPPRPEVDELVPIAEAARLLGTSRKRVARLIEIDLLIGDGVSEDSHHFVTRSSLDELFDQQRRMAIVAAPIGGLVDFDQSSDSQVARMLAEGIRELERLEREELEQEEREDREREERERRATAS